MSGARSLAAGLALAVAACFAPVYDEPRCGPDDSCPAPLVCDVDVCRPPVDAALTDGPAPIDASDAAVDATDGSTCTPRCADDVAITCAAPDETCALGCSTVGGVHCRALVPSNGVTAADVAGADLDLVLADNAVYLLDTDTGQLRRYGPGGSGAGAVVRAAGEGLDAVTHTRFRTTAPGVTAPGLGVLGVRALSIPSTTTLRPVGSRAAVIVASGSITIEGELDVSGGHQPNGPGTASVSTPGPGGGRGALASGMPAEGCAPGGMGTHNVVINRDTGGGGGGLGTAGARGGSSNGVDADGGAATTGAMLPVACAQVALTPLRGGSGGGCSEAGDDGGGGGGAVQLTSFDTIAVLGGRVFAGGAGGDGSLSRGGGGGGGAGGAVLLEAPTLRLEGADLVTGGGAGGDGNASDAASEGGRRDGQPAQPMGNGGRGATGTDVGAGEQPATDGTRPGTPSGGGTGGGGGGAGIVHLRSVTPATITGGVRRPAASTSTAEVR